MYSHIFDMAVGNIIYFHSLFIPSNWARFSDALWLTLMVTMKMRNIIYVQYHHAPRDVFSVALACLFISFKTFFFKWSL